MYGNKKSECYQAMYTVVCVVSVIDMSLRNAMSTRCDSNLSYLLLPDFHHSDCIHYSGSFRDFVVWRSSNGEHCSFGLEEFLHNENLERVTDFVVFSRPTLERQRPLAFLSLKTSLMQPPHQRAPSRSSPCPLLHFPLPGCQPSTLVLPSPSGRFTHTSQCTAAL